MKEGGRECGTGPEEGERESRPVVEQKDQAYDPTLGDAGALVDVVVGKGTNRRSEEHRSQTCWCKKSPVPVYKIAGELWK